MSFKKTLLAASLAAASTFAVAGPITGSISFAGGVNDVGGTTLQFSGVTVINATDDFTALNGLSAAISDITYNPFYSVTNPLWTVVDGPNTYSFELTSLNDVSNGSFTLFQGLGTLSGTNFDDTAGTWEYSSQGSKLTFSAETIVPVPEPATLALLGVGLAGLGFARRKQTKAA